MDRIAGFKVENASDYKFIKGDGQLNSDMPHYIKKRPGQTRMIFPTITMGGIKEPMQRIINAPVDYLIMGDGKIIKDSAAGTKTYEKASDETLKKLNEFAKTIPEELKKYIDVNKFKWVK